MQVSSTAQRNTLLLLSTLPLCASSSAGPICGRNLLATDLTASDGHTLNQSMVVQLTSEGNLYNQSMDPQNTEQQHWQAATFLSPLTRVTLLIVDAVLLSKQQGRDGSEGLS